MSWVLIGSLSHEVGQALHVPSYNGIGRYFQGQDWQGPELHEQVAEVPMPTKSVALTPPSTHTICLMVGGFPYD